MQTNSSEAEFPTTISTFRKRKKISSYHVYVLHKTWYYTLFTWYRSDFRDECRTRMKFVRKQPIERFHSRGQHLCKFMTTNEIVYIRKESNSHRIALVHQHGRHFIVLENQYGRRDVSLRSRRLEVTGTGKNRARVQSCAVYFQAAAYGDVMWKRSIILRRSLSRQIRYACAAGPRLLGLHFSVGHFRIKFSMIAITSLTGYEKRKWICWLTFFVCVL